MKSILILISGVVIGYGISTYIANFVNASAYQFDLHISSIQKASFIENLEAGNTQLIVDLLKDDLACSAESAAELEQTSWAYPLEEISPRIQRIASAHKGTCGNDNDT